MEPPDHPTVATDTIVLVMPPQLGRQGLPPLLHRQWTDLTQPEIQLTAGPGKPLGGGLATQPEAAPTTQTTVVRKPEKRERVRLAAVATGIIPLKSAEAQRARLVRV